MRPTIAAALAAATVAAVQASGSVQVGDDGLGVHVDTPVLTGWLGAEWLRERCVDPNASVHAATRQPLKGVHELERPRVVSAGIVPSVGTSNSSPSADPRADELGALQVTFADNHQSVFPLGHLARMYAVESGSRPHAAARAAGALIQVDEAAAPELFLWDSNLTTPPEVPHAVLVAGEQADGARPGRLQALSRLLSVGILRVRGAPIIEGVCAEMASDLSTLRATEWGTVFDVRAEPSAAATQKAEIPDAATAAVKHDLAYTDKPLGFHTDNPYRYPTPDFQLLHVLRQCVCDGPAPCEQCRVRNGFVDGFAVAQRIADESPRLFDALCDTPVRFENDGTDGKSALWHVAPIIELKPEFRPRPDDPPGNRCRGAHCVHAIRFSAKSGGYGPLPTGPSDLADFYEARRRFSELVREPSMAVFTQLTPGDVVVFDNKRVLHSRTPFGPNDGLRHLQGCYMDGDGIRLNYERLRRLSRSGAGGDGMGAPPTPWASLAQATAGDFAAMGTAYGARVDGVMQDTLLGLLEAQRGVFLGQPVDLREHNVQTASRALRAGERDDVVVASLFHDGLENLASKNHGGAIAAMLEPFIEPEVTWLLAEHEVFQGYYYYHYLGADRNAKERLLATVPEQSWWNATERWCHIYDQMSFDPDYPSLPVEAFAGPLQRVLSRTPYWWEPSHPKRATVTGAGEGAAS